ncbi:MAG: ABC transporter ATP-binding protein/permease [Mogibacterium sp.]|nr:ABC transporter ATP-binding protein/permease [Mogibacterium sp.]
MLELRNISKEYKTGAETVHALRDVSLAFRESEFVSVLGPSGCGKTTMLNILGGLDQYTDGDLLINGISTKEYKDADWDAYRNDTIGFVFQSYNLISHQNVLSNVELALTLSGVSAAERRARAIAALEQVGLGDQINKKPAEMSGGQVQRVAIARALINDPDIILADEPTGALDTETSTQVMSILKEISADRLVIMVTHNPELAEAYSTRIVRLSDGRVISDSNPFVPGAANAALAGAVPAAAGAASLADAADAAGLADTAAPGRRKASGRASGRRNRSMSMATALHLSLNNLMTKKARTLLTAFAGSIGIIGIALILSVSHGFQTYIDKLEEDTLSSYPLTIQAETADMTSMIAAFMANAQDTEGEASGDKVHEQRIMTDMLASVGTNDLAAFKERVDTNIDTIGDWFNAYDYSYGLTVNIYSTNMEYGPLRVSPGSIMQSYMSGFQQSNFSMMNSDVFFQMMDNEELLKSQYKVLAGKWPEKYNELLLVLDSEDQLNDYIVYTLGLRDPQELKDMINDVMNGEEVENTSKQLEWTYDDFLGMEFALVHSCDTYKRNSSYDVWEDMTEDDAYMEDLINRSEKLKITGIVCAKEVSAANAMDSGIGYLPLLTRHMIEYASESDIVKIQRENKNTDVFSGKTFESIRNKTDEGLGFEDMISIDENKLRKALGGDIDPNAVTNAIKDNIQDALEDADPSGMIKDIMTAVGTNAGAIMKDLLTQEPDKLYTIPLDDEAIDKALGDHLDTGKHRSVVNKLLKEYVAELKKQAATMREEWSGQAQALQTQIESHPEMIPFIIAQYEQQGITITEEELRESLANADGRVMLPTAAEKLPSLLEEFLKSDSTVNAVAAYAEGIALAETAKNVPPAVINTAKTVGGLIKVDAAGIADAFTMKMDEDEITRLITAYVSGGQETNYDRNLRKLGYADLTKPEAMSFYLKDFESKEAFLKFIDEYNKEMQDNGDEDKVISYTDVTGVMIKSVKNITNAVSYVLIAFVAISLIVSSIMIGVITYISVLERTKEIGILRAIGASKKDIARIFNAETIIVGLCAGVIGIGASLLLLIPINHILIGLTKISALKAILPAAGGVALVFISIFLTFIAGLIPSGMAARKDPVVALRTE